jgi:hypothetical protein
LQARRYEDTEGVLQASIADLGVVVGRDTGAFHGSEDDTNFTLWGGGQDMKEAQL